MLETFLHNVLHNLFKPLLLFFYAGFLIPIFKVKFEFPKAVYQGLTIYLLLAIGWHGGEELASLPRSEYGQAFGFMLVGFVCNTIIGITAYVVLRKLTRLRQIDAATVAGYYGSDSAGTFVTCLGVLASIHIAYAPYMPVMLAIMEIPGCLVALFLISRMRSSGLLDSQGNMPGEPGYQAPGPAIVGQIEDIEDDAHSVRDKAYQKALAKEDELALRDSDSNGDGPLPHGIRGGFLNREMLHEVFMNPGIYLLFGGITIGFISKLQGEKVVAADDELFVKLFQGMLCLFLLEMGLTASEKLKDLKTAGWPFIAFGLIAPNVFATFGMLVAHGYSIVSGHPMEIGTYVLFAVLCGAASYIAVPAVQRMAIPEASPTLPLAASLGLTFSYNVTIGIPVYIMIATLLKGGPMAG